MKWIGIYIYDDLIPKDTIYLMSDNFRINEIHCVEEKKEGYVLKTKLYPYFIKRGVDEIKK